MAAANAQTAANVADAMAAVVAVAETNVVIVQKVARRAVANSAAKVALKAEVVNALSEITSLAATMAVALNNATRSNAVNSEVRAKSSASNAHRASRVKVREQSAHAVSAANAAASSAHRWMLLSKILHWPTRQPWLQPWAARQATRVQMPCAVNAVSAVGAMTVAMNHDKIARVSVMARQSPQQAQT